MAIYLLKFSACLFVFWLLYVALFEKQNTHHLKRFYLLGSLVLSAVIPLVSFTTYIDPIPLKSSQSLFIEPLQDSYIATPPTEPEFPLKKLLWLLYGIGVSIFTIRFILNFSRLIHKIKTHKKVAFKPFIHVLLEQTLAPHSFFNYLFFSKTDYETKRIPKEVHIHEEAHAKQLHSLDNLLIELLQIVLWFNPLIYIIKHHIKLNHEFLADKAVLNHGVNTTNYQNILLDYLSHQQNLGFSSSINYSSIKKRINIMKAHTSKQRSWLTSLLLVPVIAFLLFSFAERTTEVRTLKETTFQALNKTQITQESSNELTESPQTNNFITVIDETVITVLINRKDKLLINDEPGTINNLKQELKKLTDLQKVKVVVRTDKATSPKIIKEVELLLASFENVVLYLNPPFMDDVPQQPNSNPKVNSQIKKGGPNPMVYDNPNYSSSGLRANYQDSLLRKYNQASKSYTDALKLFLEGPREDNSELKIKHKQAYDLYKHFTKNEIEVHGIKPPPPPPAIINASNSQKGATKEQIVEYNAWARELNKKPGIVKLKDYEYYHALYNQMTRVQKETAEPFPSFPPPPEPHPGYLENYNAWARKLAEEMRKAESDKQYPYPIIKRSEIEKYRNIYDNILSDEQLKQAHPFPRIPPPPPPPKPVSIEVTDTPPPPPYVVSNIENFKKNEPEKYKKLVNNGIEIIEVIETPPPPPNPDQKTSGKKNDPWTVDMGSRTVNDTPPPPPPPPANFEDALEDLIKRHIPLEYKGQSISNDMARKLVKDKTIKLINHSEINGTQKAVLYDELPWSRDSNKPKKENYVLSSVSFTDSKTGETIEVVEVPEEPISNNSVVIYVNNQPVRGNSISLTKNDLKSLNIQLSEGTLDNFKIKIPKSKSIYVTANQIKDFNLAAELGDMENGYISVFEITDNRNNKLQSFVIELVQEK